MGGRYCTPVLYFAAKEPKAWYFDDKQVKKTLLFSKCYSIGAMMLQMESRKSRRLSNLFLDLLPDADDFGVEREQLQAAEAKPRSKKDG
jgi:hypothetical protein